MSEGSGNPRHSAGTPLLDSGVCLGSLIEAAEDYAMVTLDADGRVASWNAGAERLLGWSEAAVVGKSAAAFLPSTAVQGMVRAPANCIRLDGSAFRAEVTITPFPDDDGGVRAYAVVIHDVSMRRQPPEDREQTQFWLITVLESAMDAIITVDAAQRIVLFNRAAEAMFHCSAAEVRGERLDRFIPKRLREAHARHITNFSETGVTTRTMGHLGTLTGLRSNGGEFPIEASISQAIVDGRKLYTVIVRDITQRKRAEERQSLLLLELAHRVKNTLAIVQSVVAQTSRLAAPETVSEVLTGRLVALGNAHDLLNATEWAGASLADVVRLVLAPYEGPGTAKRWTADGPAIWLASNEAVTLSLVFHELAVNAARYGALSSDAGNISIEWALDPEVGPAGVAVRWCEKGGPPVAPPARQGFGSRLIKQAISHEVGGQATLDFPASGVQCRLYLPLSQKVTIQP